MSNFAEQMKAAKEAKKAEKAKEKIELKAGDIIETDKGEKIELDLESAASLNEQINDGVEIVDVKVEPENVVIETTVNFEESVKTPEIKIEETKIKTVQITSVETQVTSSEFHNFSIAIFEKNKPTFLTEKVLNDLLELPNFKDLVDKGVIKIGL